MRGERSDSGVFRHTFILEAYKASFLKIDHDQTKRFEGFLTILLTENLKSIPSVSFVSVFSSSASDVSSYFSNNIAQKNNEIKSSTNLAQTHTDSASRVLHFLSPKY